MSIDTPSPDYDANAPHWAKMRALVAGNGAEAAFIRRLPGQPDDTYALFKAGAYYMNALSRTVDALAGLPLARRPQIVGVEEDADFIRHSTRAGGSYTRLAGRVMREVMEVNRCGVLVDYPEMGDTVTAAEADAAHAHPFARLYPAEAILGARVEARGAHFRLTQVRLKETVQEPDPADPDAAVDVEQVRELKLDAGIYTQQLYRQEGDSGVYALYGEPVTPQMGGRPLAFIPFRLFSAAGADTAIHPPLMLDVANISIAHLNNSAAYEWGLMWTGNPTPVFVNLVQGEDDEASVALGSSEGIVLGPDGRAFFLEFTGAGLGALKAAMDDKRRDMAVMGARMLTEDKNGVEATATAQIYREGENSILAAVVASVNDGLTDVLRWMAEWAGDNPEGVSCALSTEFLNGVLSVADIESFMGMWQAGRITKETLFNKLVAGKVIADTESFEDYEDKLADEEPAVAD